MPNGKISVLQYKGDNESIVRHYRFPLSPTSGARRELLETPLRCGTTDLLGCVSNSRAFAKIDSMHQLTTFWNGSRLSMREWSKGHAHRVKTLQFAALGPTKAMLSIVIPRYECSILWIRLQDLLWESTAFSKESDSHSR